MSLSPDTKLLVIEGAEHKRKGIEVMIASMNITQQPYPARSIEEALQVAAGFKTELIIINHALAGIHPESCIKQLKKEVPQAGIVCLAPHYLRAAQLNAPKQAACNSFLPEEGFTANQFSKALHNAVNNGVYYTEEFANTVAAYADKKLKKVNTTPGFNISNTEKEVLLLIYEGYRTREIAEKRKTTLKAVEFVKKNLFKKLEVYNVTMLIKKALQKGIIIDDKI